MREFGGGTQAAERLLDRRIHRRQFMRAAGLTVCGGVMLLAEACGSDSKTSTSAGAGGFDGYSGKSAVVLLNEVIPAAPLVIAAQKGFFKDADLDVNQIDVSSGSAAVQTIVSTTKFGMSGTLPALIAYSKGIKDLRIVAGLVGRSAIVFLVPSDSPIKSPADLRGAKIGITSAGSLTDYFARLMAKRNGLTVGKDVTLVPVGSPADTTTAAKQGVIDVAWSTAPFSTKVVRAGEFRVLQQTSELAKTWSDNALLATTDFIDEHPDALKAWIAAIGKAVDLIHSDPADAGKAWAQSIGLDAAITTEALKEYGAAFSLDYDRAGIEAAGRAGQQLGQLEQPPDTGSIIATGLLPAGASA